jgi:Tfp pilus assembly protein PilF
MQSANIIDFKEKRAYILVEDGKHHIASGDLDLAIQTFERSIQSKPTPEGYTYLGWVLSLKNEVEEAIELCYKAIRLDPTYGNPYNDVGSYLIKRGQLNEAKVWLEKAKEAPRYETRHFPYMNLGRIYAAQGNFKDAIKEFDQALEFSPGHAEIANVLSELHALEALKLKQS